MPCIDPGIYRIVNVGRKTAITVLAETPNTIVGWKPPNYPGQQWFVRRSGDKYHIVDCVYGRHIVVDHIKLGAKAYLGTYPTSWELIPVKETTYGIKLAGHDLVLDSINEGNGDPIHVFEENSGYLWRVWQFERLGDLPSDEPEPTRLATTEQGRFTTQMIEQLAQKDKQLIELAGRFADLAGQFADQNQRIVDQNKRIADQNQQIADQAQRIADQNQKIINQEEGISALKKQVEEDRELVQENREFRAMLSRAMQREDPLHRDRNVGADNWGATDRTQS